MAGFLIKCSVFPARCFTKLNPPTIWHSASHFDESIQASIELLAPDRHLNRIKRVLHDEVGIELVNLPHHAVNVRLLGFGEQQKLGPRLRLETLHAEVARFEDLESAGAINEWRGREGAVIRWSCGSRRAGT
jgi:hypothetical protein